MENIRAIVYGTGTMGKMMTKLMVEKGVLVVGAVDVVNVGKDLGEVAGLDHPLHVKISDEADAVVGENEADIAIVAVASHLEQMYPHLERCIKNGLNVITTAEEAFFPWMSSPDIAAKLDKLAKKHNVTVTGSGQQDVCMLSLIGGVTGESHTIESIDCKVQFNLADYGPAVGEQFALGISRDKFDAWANDHRHFIYRWMVEGLITALGLTIKSVEGNLEPIIADVDIEAEKLGKTIKKGSIRGVKQILDVETAQGIKVCHEASPKVYTMGETDSAEWHIKGVPNIHLRNGDVPSDISTAAQIVNRIPDIINAEPGFVTPDKLPPIRYRAYPLHYYLNIGKKK